MFLSFVKKIVRMGDRRVVTIPKRYHELVEKMGEEVRVVLVPVNTIEEVEILKTLVKLKFNNKCLVDLVDFVKKTYGVKLAVLFAITVLEYKDEADVYAELIRRAMRLGEGRELVISELNRCFSHIIKNKDKESGKHLHSEEEYDYTGM